ncbi:hypothetical protein PsorP6_005337 [Peronosclerospora sorghi]|uniref:Uncharacterized protein n=1 Tax=Peronosclerospora sorghi TaxID=230839 RepID=A0ACC0W1P3_9STRA|nr:hypothetical protein PsorP6_005337 [Peronosclerospora sorghi]
MLGVGSTYALSAWNSQLKTLLHFKQTGISLVSSMTLLGTYMSYIPGVIFDRLGPFTSVLLSGSAMFVIHLALFAVLQFAPQSLSPLGIGCAMMLFGLCSSFCVFSAIVPNESLFGDAHRGKVIAALTSAYSCGGAFFAFIFHEGFHSTDVPGANKESMEFGLNGTSMKSNDDATSAVTTVMSDEMTGLMLLTDLRFWMLFIPVMIIVGTGLLVMSNVSFIVESLRGPSDLVPFMVALFSIMNTLGRLLTGVVSDLFRSRYPRAYFAAISTLLTIIALAGFLSVPPEWLALPVGMAGFAEGVMFATFPVILREEFGLQNFGKNFGLVSLANCIGYPLFFSPLASFVYHQHSATTHTEDGVEKCFGSPCFGPVFVAAIALSIVSLVCCIQLALLQRQRMCHCYQPIRP